MKFGQVDKPELINFSLPDDHPETQVVLSTREGSEFLSIQIGCAKWNKTGLKNFYPTGTKDELAYYSTQFNCIEMNATFYRIFPAETYIDWHSKTPEGFKFFPKIIQNVSHFGRLSDQVYPILDEYLHVISNLQNKLGTIFLQMHNNFGPKNWERVVRFVKYWPKEFSLALEFRHTDWYNDKKVAIDLYYLLEENNIANVLVDTAGRRDLMHMRLTSNEAFIRFVSANHKSDFDRLDQWIDRLNDWKEKGLKKIHFFVHQNVQLDSPLLSAYFIAKLNKKLGSNLHIPKSLNECMLQ